MHPIEELMQNKGGAENIVGDITYVFSRDLHISPRELRCMPLCDMLQLFQRLKKEQKANEKQMQKLRRR